MTEGFSQDQGGSFVETTSTGWFASIGEAFKGIVIGLILIICSGILLFWNEGRTVKTARALNEASHNFVALKTASVDPANEGNLVYVFGDATTTEILKDNSFGISINAIRLRRDVAIYQWEEEKQSRTEKSRGGDTTTQTTYKYRKGWSDHLIDSTSFKKPGGHANPVEAPFATRESFAGKVTLGAFSLPRNLLDKLSDLQPLSIEPAMVEKIAAPYKSKAHIADNCCYLGNPQAPQIGDLKVSFKVMRPGPVSLIAMQAQNTFEPYNARSGKDVELIEAGIHSPESMFALARTQNTTLAWTLRGAGAALAFAGIFLILNPLSVFLAVIPLLGSIAEMGIGLVALIFASVFSLLIIAVAWLGYRPLVALGLAGAAVFVLLLVKMTRKRRLAV